MNLILAISLFVFLFSHTYITALPSTGSSGVVLMTKPNPFKPDEMMVSMMPVEVAESSNGPVIKPKVFTTLPFPLPNPATTDELPAFQIFPAQPDNINLLPMLSPEASETLRFLFNKTQTNNTLGFSNIFASLFGGLG